MIKAVVGAGGKTTWIRKTAKEYVSQGLKVFVTTSTHMFLQEDTLLTDCADEIIKELEHKRYVMAGIREGEKIKPLSKETYEKVCRYADVVLIEADGSKHKPIKFPAEHEPVIYENVDEIVVICGLHAIGKPLKEAAHRPELVKTCLNADDDTIIKVEHIERLVESGYVKPLKEKFPDKNIVVRPMAEFIENSRIGCIIMASGQSVRFGSNKLLAIFQGKHLYERAFALTEGNLFDKRIVVTRTKEVYKSAKAQGMEAILHDMPYRNDAIRLAMERMADMDACVFCPCDQPLLTRASIQRLVDAYYLKKGKIVRLAWKDHPGTPVLFDKSFFQELCELPEKKGGSYLIDKYKHEVSYVHVNEEKELEDIDTKEDLKRLESCEKDC